MFSGHSRQFALTSFCVLLFFLLFGTTVPFQDEPDPEDVAASSPLNQIFLSLLYLTSFLALLEKRELVSRLVRAEKYLSLFLMWCFLTVAWSQFPLVSLKRCVQLTGSVIVFTSALVHFKSAKDSLRYLKAVFAVYVPLTVLSIVFVPGATQWEFPAWRGLAEHKNMLGQISLMSLLTWSYALKERGKLTALFFWGASLVLLMGARSTTSILAAGVIGAFLTLSMIERAFVRRVVGRSLASAFLWSFLLLVSLFVYWQREFVTSFLDYFEKDTTLTGRTDLWVGVLEQAQEHLLLGCGFGGFWMIPSARLDAIFDQFVWLPTQAHSGYLDTLNETGIVGIILLALMGLSYCVRLWMKGPSFGAPFLFAVLIVNLTESTLFKPSMFTGALFLLFYLALHVDAVRSDSAPGSPVPANEALVARSS